jgi:SAM-dependent methyltransferase
MPRERMDGFRLVGQAPAWLRAAIYDAAVLHLTEGWYRAVLGRLSPGARILDVGIGTAGALARNAKLVAEQRLRVTGIDIDLDYVQAAREAVDRAALGEHVHVRHEPLEHHAGGRYDAIYFSGSFMLMPEPELALRQARGMLTASGKVFFTQSLQGCRSQLLEWIKPRLAQVTTIDFGRVSYEDEFFARLHDGGYGIVEDVRLRGVLGWSQRLVVAKPGR